MSETKIKPNQIDGGDVLDTREFVVTEDIFNKYKKDYYEGGEVLDIVEMLSEEDLGGNNIINLNRYNSYIDGWQLTDAHYIFKNGSLVFDNPIKGGCGRAISINDGSLEIDDCNINAPQCESNTDGIIELNNNSNLKIVNCSIEARIGENNKPFIKINNSFIYISNSRLNLGCMDDLQDPNIRFDFINVVGNGGKIEIRNCQALRIANDEANTDDLEFNFIKTDENVVANIELYNNVIWMHGRGWYRNILNINLDNRNCQIANNDLQGNLYCRYESNNTVNGNGYPHTYKQGDEVWNLDLIPGQMEGPKDFEFTDFLGFNFFEAVDIDPNDMSHIYENFKFQWYTIDGQSGFILNPDPDKTYTTSDLISMQSLNDDYGIHPSDDNPQNWHDGDWLGVHLDPNAEKFRFKEQVTVNNGIEFRQAVESGKIEDSEAGVYSFNNNSFSEENGGYRNFFTGSSDPISTKCLVLNGKEYREIKEVDDGVFYPKNSFELQDIFNNNGGGIIDFISFDGRWDENGYLINNNGNSYTFRNLMVNSFWQRFPWFEKSLFEFQNGSPVFMNCVFNVQNVDLDGASEIAPLLKFSTDDGNSHHDSVSFMNCGINVNNLNNTNDINIIELNDIKLSLTNCNFNFDAGNMGSASIIKSNVSNNTNNDRERTKISIEYSALNLYNVNNFGAIIKYTEIDNSTKVYVKFSKVSIGSNDEAYALVLPLNSEVNVDYSALFDITAIESQETFTAWQTNTTYNENDLLEWINPNDSDDKRYVRVLQQFTSGNDMNDIWNEYGNNIEDYYNIRVGGMLYEAFDTNGRITSFNHEGDLRLNSANINGNFQCHDTNNFFIKMQDSNINGGNDTDVLNAISELASRVASLEQRV